MVCEAYGPPDSLTITSGPLPEPGAGQVRVAVRAAGVNFVDALFVSGEYQIKIPPPFTPGGELAGVVDAVGEGVDDGQVGRRVVASIGVGAFASHVLAAPDRLIDVPDNVTDGQAATFMQSYGTAWFALHHRVGIREGQRMLVLGAGGGIGLAFTDVAVAAGVEVVAAASSADKLEAARAAGARHTVDYSIADLKTAVRELVGDVDVVVDPVGGDLADPALRTLGYDGTFLVIGFAGGSIPKLPANQILLRNRRVAGVDWGAWAMAHPKENAAMLDEVLANIANGSLHPTEPTGVPLEQAGHALTDLRERRVTGKLALVP